MDFKTQHVVSRKPQVASDPTQSYLKNVRIY